MSLRITFRPFDKSCEQIYRISAECICNLKKLDDIDPSFFVFDFLNEIPPLTKFFRKPFLTDPVSFPRLD